MFREDHMPCILSPLLPFFQILNSNLKKEKKKKLKCQFLLDNANIKLKVKTDKIIF